jgi:hypothetical protein
LEPNALVPKLDRVLAMRGDPTTGVGAPAWQDALADIDREQLLRALIAVVRELLIPGWVDMHKNDPRPQRALETAEAWLATKSEESIKDAKAAAKACTEAKNETFGTDHRVPEAARAAAWATTKTEGPGLFEALALVEAELLGRIALMGEYHRGPEQRRAIINVLKRVLLPPEPVAAAEPASLPPKGPVPYSPDGHFELGQTLIHKKFGDVTVTSVGETWIEVQIPADGSKKRLAHKP